MHIFDLQYITDNRNSNAFEFFSTKIIFEIDEEQKVYSYGFVMLDVIILCIFGDRVDVTSQLMNQIVTFHS